ncbi:MAG: flagellar export chaperone FlgN [Planctomycetota bacterium]|jgi:hypothetical protein
MTTATGQGNIDKLVNDLCQVLQRMQELYNEIVVTVESKVRAMQEADMGSLQAVSDGEHELLGKVNETEGLRRQLMDRIGVELGMPVKTARVMTVTQLATKLSEEQAINLHRAADGLKHAVAETARSNRIAGVISRELVNHLKWIWAAARPSGTRSAYNSYGQGETRIDARIFDAMG